MKRNKRNYRLRATACLMVILFASLVACSQQTNLIGVNLSGEVYPGSFRPSVGVSFETQLGKHSGAETGMYYRTDVTAGVINYTDSTGTRAYPFKIAQRYVNLPVLYKFYSRILNFSAGPTLDLFTSWKQKNRDGLRVESFDVDPDLKLGVLVKLSKAFLVSNRIIMEPEFRFASIHGFDNPSYGVGVGIKYNTFDLR